MVFSNILAMVFIYLVVSQVLETIVAIVSDHRRGKEAGQREASGRAAGSPSERPRTLQRMRTLLNLIWLVLSGLWMAVGYAFAGMILCITVVGIPFGIAAFRIGLFALWPFGRRVIDKPGAGAGSMLGNVLWLILAGWWLALGHLASGVLMCLTIIGIPLGLASFKLIPVSLMPLGKDVVPVLPGSR